MNGKLPKEKPALIGSPPRLANSAIVERCKEGAFLSHSALATANLCSAAIVVWMFSVLNQQLELYTPSEFTSNIQSFCNTFIPIPKEFLETADSASPILIFAIFWIAALAFSVTLTAWFFTNAPVNRKQPNKFLGSTLVLVALLLEIWVGVTVEEFCLIAMPITTGMGLIFGSIL